jgi:uncharacterized protein YndB with AHSA1/START domain
MNYAALKSETHEIVVDEVLPHAPETIWKALTTGKLIGRWLMMTPTGFEAVKGKRFTFQTTPGGAWDGVIHCQVLEATPNERLVYSFPGLKTERAFALSTPASCSRGTMVLSRRWAKVGRSVSQLSAPLRTKRIDAMQKIAVRGSR